MVLVAVLGGINLLLTLIIRDLLSSDIGPAVRLLEECRSLPDTKPADIAQFVNDVSSNAPGVVAVDGERIIGVLGPYRV